MARPPKSISDINKAFCLPPMRQYWREINRETKAAKVRERVNRKARDKRRRKCHCEAYKFPHRPGGGLCRYPDPPAVRWQDAQAAEIAARVAKFKAKWGEPTPDQMADLIALTTKPHRPYRNRYAGILRQIAHNNGLHPIMDHATIAKKMPTVLYLAKQVRHQCPKAKYRNMEIVEAGQAKTVVRGVWTTAGPTM
jgi:hypothetical protein